MVPETADTEMAPADTEADTQMAEPAAPALPLDEGWSQVDVATISADMLIGTDIRTYDQETVAAIEDVLMTADGKVESVVARFGGFLGFGENTVLLTMDEISVVKDADENVVVLTNLTPEALKDRPEYVPEDGTGLTRRRRFRTPAAAASGGRCDLRCCINLRSSVSNRMAAFQPLSTRIPHPPNHC